MTTTLDKLMTALSALVARTTLPKIDAPMPSVMLSRRNAVAALWTSLLTALAFSGPGSNKMLAAKYWQQVKNDIDMVNVLVTNATIKNEFMASQQWLIDNSTMNSLDALIQYVDTWSTNLTQVDFSPYETQDKYLLDSSVSWIVWNIFGATSAIAAGNFTLASIKLSSLVDSLDYALVWDRYYNATN